MITWTYNDGGRKAAGYPSVKRQNDCVTRAIAIATSLPYQVVADGIDALGRVERVTRGRKSAGRSTSQSGVYKPTTRKYMARIGWKWTPTMGIGTGCTVHLKASELPKGRLVVNCSKHIVAVIDGVIHDIYNPSRGGTRCVYGYWSKA